MLFKNIILFLITFFIIGCGGTSVSPSSFTSYEDVIVNGRVVKGPISNSTITIKNLETHETLGTTTTDSEGRYSVNIQNYTGAVQIIANGGVYTDEIDESNQTLLSTLDAVSFIDAISGYVVNITPYTTIASKKIRDQGTISKVGISNENNLIANLFMGSSFDITKVNPKILRVDTIDDNTSESIYGVFLAAFAKVTDSNASNIDTYITSFYNDMNDSIVGASTQALNLALSDGNITGNTSGTILADLNPSTNKQTSLQTIRDYADSNTSDMPTVQDYINIGISTVTSANIDEVNEQIELADVVEADTIPKIETVVNSVTSRVNVVITDGQSGVTTGQDVVFTFSFSKGVSGFTEGDIDVVGGTKGILTSITNSVYTMPITPIDNSEVDITVDIAQGKVLDVDGFGNSAAVQAVQQVDTLHPTIATLSIKNTTLGAINPLLFAKEGDTIVVDFNTTQELNGTIPTVLIAGQTSIVTDANDTNSTTWRATYTMQSSDSEGNISISVSNYFDINGNKGVTFTTTTDGTSIIYDKTAPTIDTPANSSYTTVENNSSALFSVSATDALSGLRDAPSTYSLDGTDIDDLSVNGSTGVVTFAQNPNFELPTDDNNDNVYLFKVTAQDKAGNIAIKDINITVTDLFSDLNITTALYEDINTSGVVGDKMVITFNQDIDITSLDTNQSAIFDINASKVISGVGDYNSSTFTYTIVLDENATDFNATAESVSLAIKPNTIKDANNSEPPSSYPIVIFTN